MAKKIDTDRWSEGRVLELHAWTPRLFSIRVEADVTPFNAGQFTKLGLVIDDELISRPYSYVNAPHESLLEYYFITVPEGPLSNRMINLAKGDTIYVMRKASGFLTLEEVPEAPHLWMLSTGTAIGPFLSILKTQQPWERFEQVVLVHAVRHAAELSYHDTIEALLKTHTGQFQYIPFVSREPTDFAIQARIPAAIEDGRLEKQSGLTISPRHSQVMICGNPEMVKATSAVLQSRDMQRNRRRTPGHISVENYW